MVFVIAENIPVIKESAQLTRPGPLLAPSLARFWRVRDRYNRTTRPYGRFYFCKQITLQVISDQDEVERVRQHYEVWRAGARQDERRTASPLRVRHRLTSGQRSPSPPQEPYTIDDRAEDLI
jgi:hypothetical protein